MAATPGIPPLNTQSASLTESEEELYARTRLQESPLSQIQGPFTSLSSNLTSDYYKGPEPLRTEEYGIIKISLRDLLAYLILHNPEIRISTLCSTLEAEISVIRAIGAEYLIYVNPSSANGT